MDRLIYTAMTGATGALMKHAAAAQNLANTGTQGYRAHQHQLRAVDIETHNLPPAMPSRAFAVDATTHNDFTPGPLMVTGRPLDVAVQGKSFIALALPDGTEGYTRAGALEVGNDGTLQSSLGAPVQGDGGPISIPPGAEVQIGGDGSVAAVMRNGEQTTVTVVGRIKLVTPELRELVRRPDGMFNLPGGGEAPLDPNARVIPGAVEGSNVNAAEQMVSIISLSRLFEMQMKMLQTAEQNDRAGTQVLTPR